MIGAAWVIAIVLLSTPPREGLVNQDGVILQFTSQAECQAMIPTVGESLQAQFEEDFTLQCVQK